jgi:hypothetical protein
MRFFRTQVSTEKIAILIFLCAVPILGGIMGLLLMINGFFKKERVYIIIGIGGVLLTVILYASLSYSIRHRGHFDKTRIIFANHNLNKIVRALEIYNLNYSRYPEELLKIKEIDASIVFSDPLQQVHPKGDQTYFYRVLDSGYYLFSRGFDAKPFTQDDLLPDISGMKLSKIGLKIP